MVDSVNSKKIEKEEKIKDKKNENNQKDKKLDNIKITIIIMLIVGLVLFLIGLFLLFLKIGNYIYQNIPGGIENPNSSIFINSSSFKNHSLNGIKQFYPNMKFNHNDISYKFIKGCSDNEKVRVIQAFDNLSNSVGVISFYQTLRDDPDIEVYCLDNSFPVPSENSDFFIAGEGGAKEVIQTGRYNVISSGAIYIYSNLHNSPRCNWPNVELHEIIHVLGFNHSKNPNSLMYPVLQSCDQKLDSVIISELKRLYSEPNLPDLYFESVHAIKKGRYLDFNLTIKNSGVADSFNVSFTILDEGKIIETKNIRDLKYGAGVVMEVSNFKLTSRDSRNIDIVIDYFNKTKEIDKTNNIAKIRF
ncbi:MAG: matrixin family metalloprotease [Candidatus Pacearchaeota archaeon]